MLLLFYKWNWKFFFIQTHRYWYICELLYNISRVYFDKHYFPHKVTKANSCAKEFKNVGTFKGLLSSSFILNPNHKHSLYFLSQVRLSACKTNHAGMCFALPETIVCVCELGIASLLAKVLNGLQMCHIPQFSVPSFFFQEIYTKKFWSRQPIS